MNLKKYWPLEKLVVLNISLPNNSSIYDKLCENQDHNSLSISELSMFYIIKNSVKAKIWCNWNCARLNKKKLELKIS